MLSEAQNLALVRTELDTVFFQKFDYDTKDPRISTAQDGRLFKVINITNKAHIEETYAQPGLFPEIGETEAVPESNPQVANKATTYVKDYASKISLSKDWFDLRINAVCMA